jgi:neutral ceramidase
LQLGVAAELELLYPGVYSERSIVLSATHTHAGPAGFMQYLLFNVPNLGFIKQTLDGLVQGITESIVRAHSALGPGR